LAKKLKKEGLVPYAVQDDFKFENLSEIGTYRGLPSLHFTIDWESLFGIFKNKKKASRI
jgi:hypothetical protein